MNILTFVSKLCDVVTLQHAIPLGHANAKSYTKHGFSIFLLFSRGLIILLFFYFCLNLNFDLMNKFKIL